MRKNSRHIKNSKPVKRNAEKRERKEKNYVWKLIISAVLLSLLATAIYAVTIFLHRKTRLQIEAPIVYEDLEYVISFPNSGKVNEKIEIDEVVAEFGIFNLTKEQKKRNYLNHYVIVQAKRNNELVCSVFALPVYYKNSNSEDKKRYKVVEIYCLFVSKRFRGQGIAMKHLYTTMNYLEKIYSLESNALIGLHLSPVDKTMEKAFALYRITGFTNGEFSELGPPSYKNCYEKINKMPLIDYSINAFLIANHSDVRADKKKKPSGQFLTTFTTLSTFYNTYKTGSYSKSAYLYYVDKGKKLKRVQLAYYSY